MEKVALIEEKIKRLKKTMADETSKTGESEEGNKARVFRKNLKRLQRRRRILLTTNQKPATKEAAGDKKEAQTAPAVDKSPEKAPEAKTQKAEAAAETPGSEKKASGAPEGGESSEEKKTAPPAE